MQLYLHLTFSYPFANISLLAPILSILSTPIRKMQKVRIDYQGKNRFLGTFATGGEAIIVNDVARELLIPSKDSVNISASGAALLVMHARETALKALLRRNNNLSIPKRLARRESAPPEEKSPIDLKTGGGPKVSTSRPSSIPQATAETPVLYKKKASLEAAASDVDSIAKGIAQRQVKNPKTTMQTVSKNGVPDYSNYQLPQTFFTASTNEDPAATEKVEEVQVQILLRAAEEAEAVQEKEDEAKQITPTPSTLGAAEKAVAARMNRGDEDAFPILLHSIVSDKSTNNSIVWLPCGTKFIVRDKDAFERDVMPRFFSGKGYSNMPTKYTSFTRRLKRWNFIRVPSGTQLGAYHHDNFKRDEPELARNILYPDAKNQKKVEMAAVAGILKMSKSISVGEGSEGGEAGASLLSRQTHRGKPCSRKGCSKEALDGEIYGGLCIQHRPSIRTCSHDGCTNYTLNRGACLKLCGAKRTLHNARTKPSKKAKRTPKTCNCDGCTNQAVKGGVCIRHGANVTYEACSHEGCTKNAVIKGGVCWAHDDVCNNGHEANRTLESCSHEEISPNRTEEVVEPSQPSTSHNTIENLKLRAKELEDQLVNAKIQSQIRELEDELTKRKAREELIRELEHEMMKRSAKQELLRSTVDDVISQNRETPMVDAPTVLKMVSMENGCSRGSLINIPPHVRAFEAVLSRNAEVPFKRPSSDASALLDYEKMPAEEKADVARRKNEMYDSRKNNRRMKKLGVLLKRPSSDACSGKLPKSSECLAKKRQKLISDDARHCSESQGSSGGK